MENAVAVGALLDARATRVQIHDKVVGERDVTGSAGVVAIFLAEFDDRCERFAIGELGDFLKHHQNFCFQRFSEMPFSHFSMLPPTVCSIGLRSEFDLRKTQFFERTVVKRYRLSETIFRSLDVFPHFRPKYQEPGRVSKFFRRNPTPNGHARSGFVSSSLICSTMFRSTGYIQLFLRTFEVLNMFLLSVLVVGLHCRFLL